MSRDPALCQAFVARGREVLASHPELLHTWSVDADEDHCILDFPAGRGGFDVTVEVFPEEITVLAGGAHTHFDCQGNARELVESVLGFVRDLLGPGMRLREKISNGRPYRWIIERKSPDGWNLHESMGMFLWNYFGKREERIYQNSQLLARDEQSGQSAS